MAAERRGDCIGDCNGNSVERGCNGWSRKRHGYSNSKGKCFINSNSKPQVLGVPLQFTKLSQLPLPYPRRFRFQSAASASNAVAVEVEVIAALCGRLRFLRP
jgi:hypothetical protein